MKVLDLFSGIGGFSLGLERAGMQTVAFCEIDPYCRKVLAKHWPEVPIHHDIKQLDGRQYAGAVDLICGGYPCPSFSVAGRRKGEADERYLWPEMRRIIQQTRPRWIIAENVRGHISLGFDTVAAQMEDDGFTVWPFVIPACALGAPHRRERLWIVANASGGRFGGTQGGQVEQPGRAEAERPGETVAHPGSQRLPQPEQAALLGAGRWEEGRTASECGWRPVEFGVCRGINGISSWVYGDLACIAESHQLLLAYGNATNRCASEILRLLRDVIQSQDVQWAFGGSGSISAKEILLAFLCKLEEADKKLDDISLQGAQAPEKVLRKLWSYDELSSTPYRPGHYKQLFSEHSNSLQVLSQLLAYYSQKDWQRCRWQDASTFHEPWSDGWEIGIPRVATGVPDRVARLKALGNAVVPQIPQAIGMAIIAYEHQLAAA